MDEVVVVETALAHFAEALVVSKATLHTLINNAGTKGFPGKTEIPELTEKLKDADKIENILEKLLDKIENISDESSNDGLENIPKPNWDNLGK